MASKADEKAIRKLYKERDRGYNQRDVRAITGTELATFYAIDPGAKTISNQQISTYLAWRFRSQVSCVRVEKPIRFRFNGNQADVNVLISDNFVSQDKAGKRTRDQRREHGVATWYKTPAGWKLAKFQFTKVEWVDAKGKWRSRSAPKVAR